MSDATRLAFPSAPRSKQTTHTHTPDSNGSNSPTLSGAFFPTRVPPFDPSSNTFNRNRSSPNPAKTISSSISHDFSSGHVDRERLTEDVQYRIAYARCFSGFTKEDGEALNAALSVVSPTIEHLVDDVYQHLFRWDYTTTPFLKRNVGYDGELAESLEQLSLNHPQILFRKRFLKTYVHKIFDSDWEDIESWEYMDRVGLTHTGMAGLKGREKSSPVKVDLMPCTLLLGWVTDVVMTLVMTLPENEMAADDKLKVMRAFNRLMWIQQDLFQRHYIRDDEEALFQLAAQTFATRG